MLALILALAQAAAAAGGATACPDVKKTVLAARKKYAAIKNIPWRAEDARELICHPFHITAYYQKGKMTELLVERDDEDVVYRKEYFLEGGKVFFAYDKQFSRKSDKGSVAERRRYVAPACLIERTRELKPRGPGNSVDDFDLSTVPDTELLLPAKSAADIQQEARRFELKIDEQAACPPERQP